MKTANVPDINVYQYIICFKYRKTYSSNFIGNITFAGIVDIYAQLIRRQISIGNEMHMAGIVT